MKVFDYVVIGAGILGATIARKLSQKFPNEKILLLDRLLAGMGASSFSAGLHIPYGYNTVVKRLSEVSDKEYNEINVKSVDPLLYPILFTGVVSEDNCRRVAEGFYTSINSSQQCESDISKKLGTSTHISSKNLFSIDTAHYADVKKLIDFYLQDLRNNANVSIWEGMTVLELAQKGNEVRIDLSDGSMIKSQKVIVCPGPWVKEGCFRDLLARFQIRTKKIVALHIDLKPEVDDRGVFLFDHDAFLLPLHHLGYWLFSFTCQEWDVRPDRNTLMITPDDRKRALEILAHYFPSLVPLVNSGRVFCDAYSKERVPIIAKITESSNIILAGATNGSGYRLAPGIAQDVITMIS